MRIIRRKMWKKLTLHRILHYKQLCDAECLLKIKQNSSRQYAFEYMKLNSGKFVNIKSLLEYCRKRNIENGGTGYGDNSRYFEQLRRDKLPLQWIEVRKGREKWVKFCPNLRDHHEYNLRHRHKEDSFAKETISERLKIANYRCELTGIPVQDCKTDADHWIPKEKGGESTLENCVILASPLNTSKNKHLPIEWFMKSILTNFVNLCKRVGIWESAKEQLIEFIKQN